MAITNAQQARQLYKNGGTMEDIGFSIVKPSKDGSRPGYAFAGTGGSTGGFGPKGPPGGGDRNMHYNASPNIHGVNDPPNATPDTTTISPIQQYNHDVVQGNIDPTKVDPPELTERDLDFIADKKKEQQEKQRRMLEIANRGGSVLSDNIKKIISEEDDEEDEEVNPRDYTGIAPRFMGSIFDFTGLANGGIARAGAMDGGRMMMMANEEEDDPVGGIMDLESGRQQYFLGKLVKKAVKAVKKVAKSPIGKAALLYAGGAYLGGSSLMGGAGGSFMSRMANPGNLMNLIKNTNNTGISQILKKQLGFDSIMKQGSKQTTKGLLSSPFGLITAGSLLTGLMTPKDEEENNDDYYKNNRLNIADIRYNKPLRTLMPSASGSMFAADGGLMRTGYAEGSEEPVAKKTMPL